MDFEATVWRVLPVVTGTNARGEWKKQEVIFELPGEFNRKVCVGFWGDKVQESEKMHEGEMIALSCNVESREYNGRWYTDVRAWRISRKTSDAAPSATVPAAAAQSTDLPPMDSFKEPAAPASAADTDDLPF